MKIFKKNQSILITGVSGSGKTENGKHIIDFLCHTKSDTQIVTDSGLLFEAFGNAKTRSNANSSRFCKHMEVMKLLITFAKNYIFLNPFRMTDYV